MARKTYDHLSNEDLKKAAEIISKEKATDETADALIDRVLSTLDTYDGAGFVANYTTVEELNKYADSFYIGKTVPFETIKTGRKTTDQAVEYVRRGDCVVLYQIISKKGKDASSLYNALNRKDVNDKVIYKKNSEFKVVHTRYAPHTKKGGTPYSLLHVILEDIEQSI